MASKRPLCVVSGTVSELPSTDTVPVSTISGTMAQFDAACSDGNFVYQNQSASFSTLSTAGNSTIGSASSNSHAINGGLVITDNDSSSSLYQNKTVDDASTSSWVCSCEPSQASAGTYYHNSFQSLVHPSISSSVSNAGYSRAVYIEALRNRRASNTDDSGSLNAIYGQVLSFGHFATNPVASPSTSIASGLVISPSAASGKIGDLRAIDISPVQLGGSLSDSAYAIRAGFSSASATAAWNYYGYGTAPSYSAGKFLFGTTTNNGVDQLQINGSTAYAGTITAAGTTGTRTINKPAGRVNIAAGGTSITVTNSLVTANTLIFTGVATNDSTAQIKNCVAGAGTFTINMVSAVTAETAISFIIHNVI